MKFVFLIQYTASMFLLWLIVYVLYKNPKSMLNRTCALLLSCFVIWNYFSAFYCVSENQETVMFWLNITSIGWCSFPVFALWFALVFTRKEKILKEWFFYPFVFIIPAFFIYEQWTGHLIFKNIREYYGWNGVWSDSIWSYIYYIYNFSFTLISVFLSYFFILKSKNNYEKSREF